jgi:Carboxypeptidase regulatory-like domain/TonB dependent receptor
LALFSVWSFGQQISGDLLGTVTDASGAIVPGATVEITNLGTGYKSSQVTKASGEYHFVNLPVGHYSVQASSGTATGSLKGGYQDVEVTLNKVATANIQMTVAGVATTVEVTGQIVPLDTTTANIGTTFEAKEIADSPTTSTGSGVLNLSLLNAGVVSTGGIGVGSGPSISGQRSRNNNFTVEGVDNNSLSVTGPLITVPNDAVENFTVLQNDFSPEFGHSSGGQFNQTVKSGTNTFHGTAYEYFQNRNLNAIDSQTALSEVSSGLTPSNPRYDNNRFGGNFGGPIIKNKLFFFTDWEYNPVGMTGTASTACAPTAAGYATLNSLFPNNPQVQTFQKYVPAAPTQATSPNDICAGTSYNFTPGLVGVSQVAPGIPSESWGPGTSFVNIPIGDVGFLGPSYNNTLSTANSFDWDLSQKDSVRGRLGYVKYDAIDTNAQIPAFYSTTPQRYWLVTLGEYHNFSSSVNNEFRFGFNRYSQEFPVGSATFPGLNVFPNINIYEFNGIQLGPDGNAPQETIQNLYQFIDNVSWVKGKHTFKFGGEFRWTTSPQTFTQRVRGDYEWNYFSDYVNDFGPTGPLDFSERSSGDVIYYGNRKAVYWYAGDTWRLTPKLTFTYGVRYEWTGEPQAATQLQPLNAISDVPGLITFGAPTTQKWNFKPRIGLAYAPDANTSIRIGFTMANDVLFDNLGILSLPPQVSQTCDGSLGKAPTPSCYWNQSAFLANGGLPSVPATITDPAVARSSTSAYIPNQKLPYSENFNVGIQHMWANKYTAEVRYVWTRGIDLPVQDRINIGQGAYAGNSLPTYLANPGQAALNALPLTLDGPGGLYQQSNFYCGSGPGNPCLPSSTAPYVPAYYNAGFLSNIVAFEPYGSSNYNGLQMQFNRSFTNGLQFQAAYTWSKTNDNSTAEVFSTVLTPRRPQNFQCVSCDYSTSAFDRGQRLTLQMLYDVPWYKTSSSWFMKNVVGNWEVTPIYTVQTPEYTTVQSASDANLNGDSAPDRSIVNPAGIGGTSTGVTPLLNSAGYTVAYLANNPTAQYIQAGPGALATASRNTLPAPRINNWDFSILKRVNITERQAISFSFQALNLFNHSQYVPGYISDVAPIGYTGQNQRAVLETGSPVFDNWQAAFSQHPRQVVLVMKYTF